jgi:hypothetical protein
MAVNTVGYSAQTPQRLLLDAGAIYKNLTYDEVSGDFTGELLGATSGGNEFSFAQTTRTIEIDGVKGRAKGLTVVESEEANLTVNLKELTADNIALAIAGSSVDDSGANYDVITSKGKIELTDYIDSIAFVGRQSGTNKPVVIVLENVLSMEGLTLNTQDNNEAIVPIVFGAHSSDEDILSGRSPMKIYWPKEVGA